MRLQRCHVSAHRGWREPQYVCRSGKTAALARLYRADQAGPVAIDLAKGFVSRGHSVVFGTRDVQGERALEAAAAVAGSSAAPDADADAARQVDFK
jgi:hypothetical protein